MSSWQGNRNGVLVGLMSLALMVSSLSLVSGVGSPGSEPPKTKTATTKKAVKATDKKTVPKKDTGTDAQIAAAKKAAMESIRKKQAEKIGKQRADDRFKMARELAERRRLARPAAGVKPPAVPKGSVKTAAEKLNLQGKGYDPSKVVRVPRRTGPPPAPKTQPAVVARPAVKVKPGQPPRPTHGVPTLPKPSALPRGTKLPMRGPGRGGKSAVGAVLPMGASREVAADGGIVAPTMQFPATQPDPDARAYRFDYVDTPWPDVLSDVARISGLVLVGDYKTITDTVSFRSPRDFTFTEVLHTLNDLLLDRTLDKRIVERDGIYLEVWRLPDRLKKIPPEKMYQTFAAFEAADLDPFDMALTYFEPPPGWTPFQVIDLFRPQFDDYYGTVVDGDRIQLTGLVRDHYKFRETLRALAVGPPPDADTGRTKVVRKLHVRKAAEIQQVLRQIFLIQAAPKGNRPGVNPNAEQAKQTTIVPDAANNQLIIKAAPQVVAQIMETIDTLDSGPEVRAPVVQRIVLANTGTATILQALKPILATQRTEMSKKAARLYIPPDIQDAVNVDIFPDMAGNAVVLVGSTAGVAAATEMVKQWDVAGAGKDHIIELEYADAAELTATLSNIFPIGNPKAGGGGARFQPQSGNRLLVVCSDADLERVRGLIEKLDVPPDDDASERFVHLKSARPSEIAPILEQIAGGSSGGVTRSRSVQRIIKGKRVVRRPVVRRTVGGATGPRFIPDDASRLLIVYCNDKDWEKIEPIIRRLDDEAETVEPVYHTFALVHADAADVVAMLNQMYPPPPRMKGAAMTAAYQFFADPYNNTVRVYASQPFMDEITPLIEKLDIQTQGELTIIKLEHARAEDVAVILRENFGGGGTVRRRTVVTKGKVRRPVRMSSAASTKGVVINAEPVTNSLLVTAPPETLEQIMALVADIDRESESKEPSRVILTAENRPAGEIADTLLSLTGSGVRRVVKRKSGQKAASGIAGGGALKVVPSGNRVILDGPRDDVAKAVQLFTEIDVHQQTPVFKKYAVLDAEETEAALRPMLGVSGPRGSKVKARAKRRPSARGSSPSAVQIHANIYDNTILIGAMPEDFPRIDALLETILRDGDPVDPDMPTDMGEFWVIQLRHRKAFDIAYEVEDLLKPPGKQPGPTLEEGPTERTLLVRSKPSQREKIRELVEMFDVPDTTRDMGAYSMTLDPEEKMSPKVLAELVKTQLADRTGRKVEIVGLWDTGNVEIVDVHEGEPPAVEAPVDASEKTATSQPVSPCVLPASLLRAVEAVTLGQTPAGRHVDDPIDPRLCPVCHQSPCVLPARLVRSLDAVATASLGQTPPGDDASEPESAQPPVTHNHLIVESGSSEAPSAEPAESPAADVEVAPSGPIRFITGPFGKVFVEGVTEAEQEIIDEIVSDLTSGKAPTKIVVFPMKYADVAVAAQLLNQVFNQQAPARQPQRQAKRPQIPGAKGVAQAAGQKGRRPGPVRAPRGQPSRIKVVADPRTRSLLVAAPMTDIPLIVDVLRQIDRKVPPKEQNLKIFQLESLDATQVVENLREVLGLSGGSRRQPGRGGARGQVVRGGQQAAQQRIIQMQQGRQQPGQATVVSSESIKLTAEAQTNSIIAQAPPDTLELIAKLIEDLESGTNTTKKEMRRVHLDYAKATEVATIVRDVAAQTTTARPGGGGRGRRGARRGGGSSSSTGVSVNADARTNSVILAGQAKDLDQVEEIVKELDVDTGTGEGIRQFSVRGDAKSISSALKSVFGAGGKDADVVISSDTSTGTVLVKAPAKEMEEIERQISEMDSKVAMSQQRQSIEVKLGDAEKIAQNLQELFRDSRSRRGSKQNITIKGNKSSKRLYVTGADDETFKQITKIAKEMDQSPTDIQVKAFHLEHASAIDVDQKLTTMMGKAMATGGVDFDLDLVGVVPDARTNSLIVTGGPMTFALIGEVLKQIDVEPETPIARETKSYTLPRTVNANEVSNNIKALFRGQSFKRTGIEAPTVTANMSSNIVTVLANATQHEQIKTSIIDPILAAVGEPLEAYRVPLKYQRAEDIKPTLEDFMNKWRQSRGSKPQDAFTITADPNANMLLLNCSPSTYAVFDLQLKAMDTEASKPITRELKTYSLKYANINSVRDAITQAFRRTGRVPERDQVAVSLDSNTNSVLVLASKDNHGQITQMIASMDVEGGAGATQDFLYEVKNARAVDLANTLNNIIHNSRTPTRGKYPINVIGDDATNRLVVTASQVDYESILKTIEALDVEGATGMITKTFTAKYAEPWNIPRVITEQFRTRSRNPNDQVVASYINGTMSVVVTASLENMAKVEALIEQADVPSADSAKETRFFKLVNARADGLARMLNEAHRAATPRPRNGVYPITYGSDMNSNMLVVTASADRFEAIAARIAELDGDETAGRTTRSFPVKYVAGWTLASIINQQFRSGSRNPTDQVQASYEDGTMSIIVTANDKNMQEVEKLIAESDKMNTGNVKETRFIQLDNARADELARSLNEAFRAKTVRSRQGQWPVTVTADVASNNLIVTATTELFEEINRMVAELDVTEQGAAERLRRVFKLTYADPGSVQGAISESYRQTGRNPSPRDVVAVARDWTTNSVIVTASRKNMEGIASLIEEIDQPGDAQRTQHVIEVTNTNASDVARSLQDVFNAANRGRRQRQSATIRAIEGTTKIAVYANTEELEQIKQLVKQIDIEGGRAVHTIVMPELVPAKTVADTINDLFGGGRRGRGDGVHAEYHEPTNTLLVHATESEFKKIKEQVIDVLSTEDTKFAVQDYRIHLKYAVADEVARTLQEFFDKKSGSSGRRNLPPWMRFGGSQEQQRENQVSIIAEPSSNMLLISCTEKTKARIDDIIAEIDVDPSENSTMEMVSLKYMDAADMLDILTEYLRVSKRSPEDGGRQGVPWWARGRQNQQEEKTVLAGDMRLKAVESLNAIIVAGKPEGVADTVAKIEELDQPDEAMNRPVTIKLAHYNASELADILKQMYEDRSRQRGGRGGSSTQAPTIVPVEATNSLLVKGKRSDVSLIEEMAKNLDADIEEEGGGGVRIVQLKAGRDVEELARKIEDQINEVEENKKRTRRDYQPDKVSIGADVTSNSLLVSASKAKFEEVKELVKTLEDMGPVGGTSRQVIRLKNLSPDQARQLIEQLQQGGKGSNTGRGGRSGRGRRRGRRSDVSWHQGRRLDRALEGGTVRRMTVAGTLPVFFAQVALGMAVAQTPNDKRPAKTPQSFTIRKVQKKAPTTQPKRPASKVRPAKRGAAKVPAVRRGGKRLTPEQAIRATTQPSAIGQMSAAAQQAFRKRLSNAPISVSEAGPDAVIIEANDQDMEVIQSILEMLDTALPQKTIEYIALHNAQARELAGTLQNVFSKIEKIGERSVRPEDKVDIIADPGTNGLYIAATADKMKQAMELIRQNEEAAGETTKLVRTIPFKNRRVSEVGETLRKMTTAYLRQKGLQTDAIQIEIDAPTNSIFVTAGEADLKFVEQIIKGLDAELPPAEEQKYQVGTADIMIVPLRVAEADKLGTLLNELLQKAATGDTPMKDFIRRFRLLDEHGEPLATVDLNRPIVIFGEEGSNSLIIASTKENCLIMKQVAMVFDAEPARAAIEHKILTLVHADATEVTEQLNAMLSEGESLTQRPGKSGGGFGQPDGDTGYLVYKAVVKADPRTNQVVVIGRPDAVKLLTELAASLDVKGLDVMPFEIVKLEYASAAALETALTDMIDKRAESLPKGTGPNADKAEKVVIKGDPRSRSLIIAARKVRMEELKGLIHRLDVPATGLVDDIRTITLKEGNATEMADTLKTLWEQRKQEQEGTGGFKLEVPAIVADARSNSLIVAASKGDFEAIEQVVAKIESLELNPMANIYIVTLKYNSAQQLSSALTALFQKRAQMRTVDGKTRPEDEVEIQVDEVTNSLLVAASRENIEVLRQKVAELDQETGIAGQVEFFICDNIEASRVKDTVDELFGGDGVFKPGAGGDSALAQKRERVTVTIDSRANMLIVSASPENMSLVRQVYTRMNSVQTPWDAAITKLITIEHGDAVRIAAQLQEHFDKLDQVRGEGQGGGGNSGFGITVFADERSNRIIIGGTKDGIDRAVSLTHQLDVPPGDGTSTIVVYGPLREASVARIGEMIRNVFQERNQSRGSGPQVQNIPVTVEPDERSNTLLVSASREDHALIKDVIDRLDRRSNLLEMVKLYPLKEARAERIKEILDELFQAAGGGDGGAGATVGVTVDERTNAVLVAAPPGELENLDVLIQQLDTVEPVGTAEIGIFQCENEDASKMVDLLNEILTGAAAAGGGGGGAGQENDAARSVDSLLIKYDFQDEKGRQLLMQMMQKNVRISFNERTNNVIVVAPPASLHLMEALIRKLDRIQKRAVMVKVFALVQADATRMVDLLEAMFAQDEGSDQQRAFQQGREFEVEGGLSTTGAVPSAASQGGPTVKGTFGRPKTTFTADERTNSVIAAGWPEDIDVVADIIDQLDSRTIRDRDYVVYSLINAQAADVQSALDAYFQAEQARMDRLGDNIAPQRRMDQEVSVVAHEESNQLLISASPRFKSSVLNMVEQLDLPPPQVMIQVMIAEVTLSDRFEMGLEFALQQLRFSETALPGGNGVLQSTHFDVIGGTDVGAAGSGVGGFSFTITGEDFNFLVRALQSDSRLEVIQRPMIMCQDNQEANITIGNSVPFVRNTQVTDNGQVTSQIEYEDIGIILDVTPHINPDGWVYLRVAPEISAITDSTIDVGNGVLAPVFTSRTADTTVAVKDGETVVIGGLITTSENESETKVPFLGDLPGIGALFRSMSRTKDKTELLIALTPRIVRTVEDGRRLSIEERDGSGIITENMKQSPLFEGLQVFPESEGEIEDIEAPPTVPGLPPPIRKTPRRHYGPKVPEYGPRLPASDEILTRRDGPAHGVDGAR
ncbi:MAG: secretin N-terminal domain-containing protein [Phycisphaerae bacterium]